MRREYQKRIKYVVKRLNEMPGIFCPTPEATFYLFPNIMDLKMPSSKFCEYIAKEAKVGLMPGIGFGLAGEGHFRLSLVKPMEVLEKAMDGMEKAVKILK
jgi:aspartate/methionine/tyrosine aminotransferase